MNSDGNTATMVIGVTDHYKREIMRKKRLQIASNLKIINILSTDPILSIHFELEYVSFCSKEAIESLQKCLLINVQLILNHSFICYVKC